MLDKLRVPEWCCAVRFNTDDHTVFDDLETPLVPDLISIGVIFMLWISR